ncbi:MAG TPA: hypothetical protein VI729_00430, partial [Anaerolineales bacterium]|nr:hypothetical protein [Anaerolineales bacterium]
MDDILPEPPRAGLLAECRQRFLKAGGGSLLLQALEAVELLPAQEDGLLGTAPTDHDPFARGSLPDQPTELLSRFLNR